MTDARAHNARSPSPMVPGAWHEEYDGNASLRRRSSTLPVPVVQSTKAASSSTDTPLHLDHVVDFQHRLSQSLQSNSAAQKLQSFVPSVFRPFSAHPKEDLEARGSRPSSPSQLDGLSPASRLNKRDVGSRCLADTSTAAYSPPISPNRHTYKRLDDTPPASPARSPRLSMRGSPASRVRTATSISTLNSSPFFSGHGNFSGESPTTTSRPSLSIGHPSASSFSSSPMTSTNSPLTLSPMMFSSPASRRDFDGTDQPSAPKLYGVSSRGSTDSLHVGSHRHDFEPLSSNRLNVTPGEERLSPLRPIRRSPGTPSPSPRRPRPSADSFLRNDYFNFGPAQGPQSAQLSSLNIENASVFSNRMLTTLSLPGSPDISTSMDLTPLSIDSHLLITASTSEAATPDEQIPWTLSMEGLSEASPALSLPESLALSPSPSLRARLGLDRDEAGHLVVFPSPSTTSPNLASRTFDTQADTLRPLALEDSMDGVGDTTRAFLDSSVAQFAATYLNSTFDHSEEDALPLDGILSHGRARQNTPHSPVVSSVQTGAVSPSTTAARQQYLRQVSTTPELVNPGVLSRMRQLGSRMRTLLLKDKGASHKLDVLMTQTIRRRSYHSPARREAEYLAPRRPPSPPSRARSAHILRSRPIAPPRPSEPTSANGSSIGHSTPLVTSLPPTPPDTQALRGRNIPTSPPDGAPASMVPPSKTRRRFSLSVFGLSSPLHARTPPSPSAIQHRQARTTSSPLRIAPNRRPHSMALIFPPGGESPRQHAPESRERHNGSLRNASAREMDQFMPDVPIEDIVRIMDENEEGYEDRERLLGPPGLEDFNVNRTRQSGGMEAWMRRGKRRRNSVPIF